MPKQRRQAMGMWTHDVANDEWDPWDGSIRASGCPLSISDEGELRTIGKAHNAVHAGHVFRWSLTSVDTGPLDDNASAGLFFSTCNIPLHITFQAISGGDAEMHFYEGTSACGDGTAASIFNLNRTSSIVTTVVGTTCPTVDPTDEGQKISSVFIVGGIGPKSGGDSGEEGIGWIMAASQTYLLQAINRAGAAKPMSIIAQWEEHS